MEQHPVVIGFKSASFQSLVDLGRATDYATGTSPLLSKSPLSVSIEKYLSSRKSFDSALRPKTEKYTKTVKKCTGNTEYHTYSTSNPINIPRKKKQPFM
jgi:hypothetical protein